MSKTKLNKIAVVVGTFCLGIALSLSSHALTDNQKKAIEERVKPVGSVCLEGDTTCGAAVAAASSGPRSGEDVYNASCMACHGTGAGGAPKMGDTAAWKPRVAKGAATLHKHAIDGFNAMPAKGLCMTCSDDEVSAAVDFILAKSK